MLTIKEIAKVVIYLNKTINIKTTKTIAIIITEDEITKIFCMADDFGKIYDKFIMVNGPGPKRERRKREYHRTSKMSDSKVIAIMIMFHFSGYKCLKYFYVTYVLVHMRHLFPTSDIKVCSYHSEADIGITLRTIPYFESFY